MKWIRWGLVVLVCLLTAAVLFNPFERQRADGRTDIILWGLGLGPDSKGFEAVIREFERRNPQYRVRVLSMGAGRMNPQKLMTSIVGNVPPDVINQDRFSISDWASRGAFRPLNDLIERDAADPLTPKQSQYYPKVWEEASYDGRIYGIPTSADNRILYWNREVFRANAEALTAAGLDPNRAPRTWTELLAYSKVLTKFHPDGRIKQAGFLPNFGNSWLYMFAFQMNANFMSEDGRRCTMNTPAAQEALQFIIDGYKIVGGYERATAFQSGFQGGENDAFVIGQVAMKIDGDWILESMARYAPTMDFGVAPPPVPDDRFHKRGAFANETDTFVTWVGGFSLGIPKGARNVEGAWKYIQFATSTEGRLIEARAQKAWQKLRGRNYVPRQSGSIEANEAVFREFRPEQERFAAALRQHIDLMPYGRIRPVTFVGQPLWDEHVRAMENVLFGTLSINDALQRGQDTVQRRLDAFFEKERFPVIDMRLPVFISAAAAVGTGLFCWFFYSRQRLKRLARHEARWAYAFIAPWLIGFLVFTLGPMIASLFFSFTEYNVLSDARWVGLKNYADLGGMDRENITKAFGNVLFLAGVGVPLGLFTGLAVALLLNSAVRGMRFYRTFFYMPSIVPGVASAVLWIWILTSDPNKGLINALWNGTVSTWFGTPPPGWLNSPDWAKPSLILMGLWGAGSGMILWLAGLKGVPSTLYEAASLDGATPGRQFWNVTLPMLSPIVFFNAVMGFIGALQEFDRVYIMRPSEGSAGPADSLLTPVFHLFTNGFNYFSMGYASALAWLIFAIILLLTLIQFKLAPRWVHYEADK